MIEDIFIQYGAIGASFVVLASFFYRYYKDSELFQSRLSTLIENNTIALTKVYEVISKCPTHKRKV